jgi:uncharacterized membrane protein
MPDSSVPLDPDDRAKIIARFEGIERSMNALRLEIELLMAAPLPPTTETAYIPERETTYRAEPTPPAKSPAPPVFTIPPKPSVSESVLVTRALLFIGIALLLFGTAYALQLAFQHDLIGPRARVALGLIAGIAVTFAGSRLRKNTYRYLGEGLIALGTGVLYLSLWAAAGPYHFISSFVGCIAMFAVTIALAALAYARQSERIALLGLVGGYITPLLLGYDPSERVALAAYLLILGGLMLALAQIGRFQLVEVAVFIASLLYANDFAVVNDVAGWTLRQSIIVATLFFAELSAALIVGARRLRKVTPLQLGLVACNVGAYVAALSFELADNRSAHAFALLALAAVLLIAAVTKLLPAATRLTYGWLALATATLAVPVFFVGDSLAQILTVEAAILGFAGARLRNVWLGGGSALLFLLAGWIALYETFSYTGSAPAFLSERFATNALFVVAFAITLREVSARADRANLGQLQIITIGWFVANAFALFAISVETIAATDGWPILTLGQHGQFWLSILWIGYAAVAFFGGLARHDALWRRVGLAVFGLTVVKVFVYDLSFLDLALRVLSFGALGIVLVVASALYQRSIARETTAE